MRHGEHIGDRRLELLLLEDALEQRKPLGEHPSGARLLRPEAPQRTPGGAFGVVARSAISGMPSLVSLPGRHRTLSWQRSRPSSSNKSTGASGTVVGFIPRSWRTGWPAGSPSCGELYRKTRAGRL